MNKAVIAVYFSQQTVTYNFIKSSLIMLVLFESIIIYRSHSKLWMAIISRHGGAHFEIQAVRITLRTGWTRHVYCTVIIQIHARFTIQLTLSWDAVIYSQLQLTPRNCKRKHLRIHNFLIEFHVCIVSLAIIIFVLFLGSEWCWKLESVYKAASPVHSVTAVTLQNAL